MTEKRQISIVAFVSQGERAAVQLAANHLARVLSQAAAVPWTCDCVFSPEMKMLRESGDAAIIVTSLLPELENMEESWPQAEQRLRTAYAALGERGNAVFICTIFRHVGDEEAERASALRIRIRRLNLLAAEISRETRAYVVDLDRVMADIGARRLQTDHRLAGTAAIETAGHFIALTLINDALDAVVSFEIQDAAKEILAGLRPALDAANSRETEITLGKTLLSMGQGRRKQIITPVIDPIQQNHAGWLIREVLRGRIGPAEGLDKLVRAIRRHGVRESAFLITSGLSKSINRKK